MQNIFPYSRIYFALNETLQTSKKVISITLAGWIGSANLDDRTLAKGKVERLWKIYVV